MIRDSFSECTRLGKEAIFDAEHFFDGYVEDPDYSLKTLLAAIRGGASTVALCDTNGGNMPWMIWETVGEVVKFLEETDNSGVRVGIHTHNDTDNAVANTLIAVRAGASQVQAALNGWGERTGNANIVSVIANLKLKLGFDVISDEQLTRLTETAGIAQDLAN